MAPPMVQLYHNRNVNKNSLLFKVDYTRTYKNNNSTADHRITVYDCIYDGSGNVTGFKIVDSGFGLDQVSKEQFQIMYEGDEIHSIDEESIILLTYTK